MFKKICWAIVLSLVSITPVYAQGVSSKTAARIISYFTAPPTPHEGDVYYDLTTHGSFTYNGTTWVAMTGGGGSGANTALSNLASVAINTALIPNANGTLALGSASNGWINMFFAGSAATVVKFISVSGGGATGFNGLGYTDLTGPFFYDDNAASGNGAKLTLSIVGLSANRVDIIPNVAGTVVIGSATASTVGAAGAASTLPIAPLGYLTVTLPDGTAVKIPYYNP